MIYSLCVFSIYAAMGLMGIFELVIEYSEKFTYKMFVFFIPAFLSVLTTSFASDSLLFFSTVVHLLTYILMAFVYYKIK